MTGKSFLIALSLILCSMSGPSHAIKESDLGHALQNGMMEFFNRGRPEYFYNREGDTREIHYRVFRNHNSNAVIAISPGRGESDYLYAELIYDLFHAGFSVAIVDHYGQGESPQRSSENPESQNIEDFDIYSQDFTHFLRILQERVFPNDKIGVLAHSAGSVIAINSLLQPDPPAVSALAVTSLMMAIRTDPVPECLAKPLAFVLAHARGSESIAPFQKHKRDAEFNRVMKSSGRNRRELLRKLHYERNGKQSLYPSIGWVRAAIRAPEKIARFKGDLKMPILSLAGTRDGTVDPNRGTELTRLSPGACEVTLLPRSAHDLWQESDSTREVALQKIIEFFRVQLSK
jgi:lysophospholipase